MTHDQLDKNGEVVRSHITLGPYDVLPDGHKWVDHVITPSEAAAKAAMEAQHADDEQAMHLAKADSVIQYLVTHTPAESDAYIRANVTNLATAVNMLAKFAVALCVLSKREFR
mgnify:FL=1